MGNPKLFSENVACFAKGGDDPAEVAKKVVDSWINTPSNRENILKPDFKLSTVAVSKQGKFYGFLQNFYTPPQHAGYGQQQQGTTNI